MEAQGLEFRFQGLGSEVEQKAPLRFSTRITEQWRSCDRLASATVSGSVVPRHLDGQV